MAIITESNDDASADSGTQYSISLGDVFQGALDPAIDKDWIRVELSDGTIYDISLTGVELSRFELLDSEGNHVVSGDYLPTGSKLIFNPTVSGTYYINIGSDDNDYSGDYEISIVENTIPTGTYDEIADYLTDGFWERQAFDVESGGVLTADITALTEDGQQLARWALEAWTNVTGIIFEFVDDDNADITFDDNEFGAFSSSTSENGIIISSHVNVSTDILTASGTTIGSNTFGAYLHEIGHALGLGHPGPYSGFTTYGIDNIYLNDSDQVTVMSYFSQTRNTYIDASEAQPVTPMIADIIAIQKLYGVPTDINAGDTVYGYQSNVGGYLDKFFQRWTGEGNPFLDIDVGFNSAPVFVDLDGDDDPDLIVGSHEGTLYYFENTGTSVNPSFMQRTDTANPLDGVYIDSLSTPAFVDLDGDSDPDLVIGSQDGAVHYFGNTGTATNPDFTELTGVANPLDSIAGYLRSVFADLDGDGDLDLVIKTPQHHLLYLENTGTSVNPGFTERTGASNPLDGVNLGSDIEPAFADLDGDGDPDFIIGKDNGDICYYENIGTATNPDFTQRTGAANPLEGVYAGFLSAPVFTDLDGDNDLDLVIGNQDGAIHYFENTGTRANPSFTARSLARPATLTLYDSSGSDTLDLRTDTNDQRVYLLPEGISDVYGLTGNLIIARDTVIENFIAGSGDDLVAGNAVANYLSGRDGDDRLWGSGGDDILEGGAGADRLDGDAGLDWVSYRGSDAAVTVNLADGTVMGGHAEGDVLTEIENVIGSDYGDVLWGDGGANRLDGGEGNDELRGNDGNDKLYGGAGADTLNGGAGDDYAYYTDSGVGVLVRLHAAHAVKYGDAEGDTLIDIEHIVGSNHNDVLAGDGEDNLLDGGDGDDVLYGGPAGGDDEMYGGNGDDRIFGGKGNDILTGGEGNDYLKGGPGEDTFIVDGDDMDVLYGGPEQDTFQFFPSNLGGASIRDFNDGEDVIDLTEFTGINSMDDLDIVSHGDNVRIEVSGSDYLTTIILSDFDVNNLDATDFLF